MKYFLSDIFYTEIKKETASLQSNKDTEKLYITQYISPTHHILAQRITKYTRPTHYTTY